jgi:hypothetical protein
MKKLIALFVVAILFSVSAYAGVNNTGDTWTSGTMTAEFQAYIVCTPSLDINEVNYDLGNFFNNGTWDLDAAVPTVTVNFNGPTDAAASYNFDMTVSGTNMGIPQGLAGADIAAWFAANLAGGTEEWPSNESADIKLLGDWTVTGTFGCETPEQGIAISFNPEQIEVGGTVLGAVTFTAEFSLEVTI